MSIQKSVEEVLKFLRWIAELIVTKNWFALLGLLTISIYCLFTPPELNVLSILGGDRGGWLTRLFEQDGGLPSWYVPGFVLIELGLIVSALVIAVRSMPKPDGGKLADVAERKAIKGLRPFSSEDAAIFAKLQRTQSLRDCLESITSKTFRFGILMGESGCGKTSFLQAGLWPQLSKPDATHAGIYVRFSDQDPIYTIAKALAEQLELPLDWLIPSESAHTLVGNGRPAKTSRPDQQTASQPVGPALFLTLLTQVTDASDKPLVLLLDQFEQFFVHYKRAEQRQPFVQALAQWYRSADPLPVKILVSIRSDLMYQLDDLHQALGYALGPQEVVQLKKFTPAEAASILGVIAREEHLAFERKFVIDLADQELANREDGLISPVDLQILAWMIDRQTGSETRAFNRIAFQKFGGVEGLLQRFLERTLEARVTQGQRQSAVKVLLALTDLDRQARAGVLTVPMLEGKLKDTVKSEEVKEAVTWLARGDVRLITPQAQDREMGYELAHERLIPALMQQAGKELSAADKANQLLDRRVNEWLGNQRQSRYWFGLWELWQIERQLPYLVWGPKRRQKEQLLRFSRRRVYGIVSGLTLVAVIAAGVSGWWFYTPSGQMQQVRSQLFSHLENAGTFKSAHVALAYAKHGEWAKAQTILKAHVAKQDRDMSWFIREVAGFLPYADDRQQGLSQPLTALAETIEDDRYKSLALRAIVAAAVELNDDAQAAQVLEKSLAAAETIEDKGSKSLALGAIVAAYVELNDTPQAAQVLEKALAAAETIEDDWHKSRALGAIVAAYVELNDTPQAAQVLEKALAAAETIEDDWHKSLALRAIVAAYVELNDTPQAAQVLEKALAAAETIEDDGSKSWALRAIAAAAVASNDDTHAAKLLEKSLAAAETIEDDGSKSPALGAIAAAAVELNDTPQAAQVLEKALAAAKTIEYDRSKSEALSTIAAAAVASNDDAQAAQVLEKSLAAAETIEDDGSKSEALSAIAAAAVELNDTPQAAQVLEKALAAAKTIEDDRSKSEALGAIVAAAVELNDDAHAAQVLEKALAAAETIESDGSKSSALSTIAAAAVALNDTPQAAQVLEKTLAAAETIEDDWHKSEALSATAAAAVELNDDAHAAQVLEKALAAAETIESDGSKSSALGAIVAAYVELNDDAQAAQVLGKSLAAAETIEDARSKSSALSTIAAAYVELNDNPHAAQVLEKALAAAETIETIEDDRYKSSVLSAIAAAAVELNDDAQAAQVLEKSLAAAETIEDDEYQSEALSAIAAAAVELNDDAHAAQVLEKSLAAAETIEDDWRKSEALSATAAAAVELNDDAQAAQVLEKSLAAAKTIEHDWHKSEALSAIAAAAVELNDDVQAAQVLEKSLAAAETIEDDGAKSSALSLIIETIDQWPDQAFRQALLEAALQSANGENASVPMVKISALYAKQHRWGKALAALRQCQESKKIVGLTQIFTAQAEGRNLRLIQGALVLPEGEQGIQVMGNAGSYTFEVSVQSPDEDCDNYADWIEIITPNGMLKGREVYTHPHLGNLTFTATLSSLEIQPSDEVIVRAHFHGIYASGEDPLIDIVFRDQMGGGRYEKSGYTDQALRGSVAEGFRSVRISEHYAKWLEKAEPLPVWEDCELASRGDGT